MSSLNRRDFLRRVCSWAGGLTLCRGRAQAAVATEVVTRRLARLGPGANVGRWFRHLRGETARHFAEYIADSEAALMVRMGLRHVRLCLQPRVVMDVTSGTVRHEVVASVEAAIERFQRAGLAVVVDLHQGDRTVEMNPAWHEVLIRFWTSFAARMRRLDPELTLLELLNEPVFEGIAGEWNALNHRLAAAVRCSAPEHTLLTSGPNWGGIEGLKKLQLLSDRNVIYSFHFYDPFAFTHQGATWSTEAVKPLRGVPYPSSVEAVAPLLAALADHPAARRMIERYGRESWNEERLAGQLQEAMVWSRERGVPVYCGEFGVYGRYARPVHRANWFRDFGRLLAQHLTGWAVWGWDEEFGLNRRWVGGRLVVDETVAQALGLRVGVI